MASVITRTGKGAAITQAENDANLDSLCGVNESQTSTTYTVDSADQNGTIEFSNASPVSVTLTLIATIIAANDTSDFQVTLKNIGAGDVTIAPTTDTFDDSSPTKVLAQYEWIILQTDSTQTVWNIVGSSDASKVDGLDAAQFLRSDTDDTATGNLILSGDLTLSGAVDLTGSWLINAAQVTPTAAEINILDGVTANATEINLLENATATDITASSLLAGVVNAIYPVGSVYLSTLATNPGTLLGIGTWVATGVGSVLVGVGTSDETYALDDTGGESITPTDHTHTFSDTSSIGSSIQNVDSGVFAIAMSIAHTHDVSGTTSGSSTTTETNMPPYLVVQMWERTA